MLSAVILLYLLSLPPVAYLLMRSLEQPADAPHDAQAIVVLGGGTVRGQELTGSSLERLRHGVMVGRQLGLPLLLAGGDNEAIRMGEMARGEFEGEIWLEDRSFDTHENALFSAPLLRERGVDTVLLVSHAYHLRRARREFERQGFQVRCAPIGPLTPGRWRGGVYTVLPSSEALSASSRALEEWMGVLYYRLRHG